MGGLVIIYDGRMDDWEYMCLVYLLRITFCV